jgi:DNA polymerase alpha subunit A
VLISVKGLDPARYQSQAGEALEKQFFTFESQISDKERFKDADPLPLRCMACESTFKFEGILDDSVSREVSSVPALAFAISRND